MDGDQFSEGPYYAGYEAVRDQFRGFDSGILIGRCIEYLHQPFEQPLEYLGRQPWCALLLIKWILVDDRFDERDRPAPTREQTVQLLQRMVDLGGKVRLPSQHDYSRLFLRSIAFQQFLYQYPPTITQTGRQMLYFGGLGEDHYIPRIFILVTGLSLSRFLELWGRLTKRKKSYAKLSPTISITSPDTAC